MSKRSPELVALEIQFQRVYAGIPLAVRKEVVLLINDEPITWEVASDEINLQTELSEYILNKLSEFGII